MCTAYYITKHPKFSPDTHHITILEARRPAGGASGKAGGLLAMWAFPQQIVPLSFQLHQELAEEYNGATEWGYRGLKTLSVEGNISASNLRNLAKQSKKSKKPEVDLPKDLDWINTDIIDGWAHLGGADSTAQVHPYKFTLFMLKKVLETGAVDLITGKVTEIIANDEGQATGVKYTTFIDKRNHNNSQHAYLNRFQGGASRQPTPAQQTPANKSSLHHPDNPTFNSTPTQKTSHPSLHTGGFTRTDISSSSSGDSSEASEAEGETDGAASDSNTNPQDTAGIPSSKSTSSISESSEASSTISTDDESQLSDDNNNEDLPVAESADGAEESLSDALPDDKQDDDGGGTATNDHVSVLEGDQIVLTLGPWTSKILPSCPISGLRAHSITIQPSKSVSPFALFTEMRTSRTSYASPEIYPRKDEVYVCGEGDTFAPVPESTDDVEVLRDRCDELFKHVGDISPQLKNGRILKRQACYLPVVDVPSHSGPFIGSTNVDHLYLASGHSCWGINNAPATGLLMAEILLDGEATSASVDGLEPEFYFDAASSELAQ